MHVATTPPFFWFTPVSGAQWGRHTVSCWAWALGVCGGRQTFGNARAHARGLRRIAWALAGSTCSPYARWLFLCTWNSFSTRLPTKRMVTPIHWWSKGNACRRSRCLNLPNPSAHLGTVEKEIGAAPTSRSAARPRVDAGACTSGRCVLPCGWPVCRHSARILGGTQH